MTQIDLIFSDDLDTRQRFFVFLSFVCKYCVYADVGYLLNVVLFKLEPSFFIKNVCLSFCCIVLRCWFLSFHSVLRYIFLFSPIFFHLLPYAILFSLSSLSFSTVLYSIQNILSLMLDMIKKWIVITSCRHKVNWMEKKVRYFCKSLLVQNKQYSFNSPLPPPPFPVPFYKQSLNNIW